MIKKLYKNSIVITVFIMIIYAIIIFKLFSVFIRVDDIGMKLIESGALTMGFDAHNEFMNYSLSIIISGLYAVIPYFDWHSLFLIGSCYLSIGTILYRSIEFIKNEKTINKILIVFIEFMLLSWMFLYRLTSPQFTTSVSVIAMALMFFYATSDWKNNDKKQVVTEIIVLSVLLFLAYCIRPRMFYLFIPFLGLIFLIKLFSENKEYRKIHLICALIFASVIGITFIIDSFAYGSGEYKELKQINALRSKLSDYEELPEYSECEEFYKSIDISRQELNIIKNQYFCFANKEIEDKFEKILDVYDQTKYMIAIRNLKRAIMAGWSYFKLSFPALYLELFVMIVVLIIYVLNRDYFGIVASIVFMGIEGVVWIYFGFKERYPERIIYSLHMINVASQCSLLVLEYKKHRVRRIKINKLIVSIVCLIIVAGTISEYNMCRKASDEFEKKNNIYERLYSEISSNNDKVYMLGKGFVEQAERVKMFENKSKCNYFKHFGWCSIHPAFREKLTQDKFEDTLDAIRSRDDIRLVTTDVEYENIISEYADSIGIDLKLNLENVISIDGKRFYILSFMNDVEVKE